MRMRTTLLCAAAAAGLALAGCSSSSPAPSASSAAPTTTAATAGAPSPSPTDSVIALSKCTSADVGVRTEYAAWQTLMKSDSDFASWVKDTAAIQSSASNAQSFDSTFGAADNASAAGSLAFALRVVESDLQQGVQTGEAPLSYQDDVQAAIAAEAPFEACTSAS